MRIKYRLNLHPFLTLDPLHIAKQYPAFCVGIPPLRTKTYGSPHIIRTLADSEAVAPRTIGTPGRAKRLLTVGAVHKKRTPISRSSWCTSRDSNPGPTD